MRAINRAITFIFSGLILFAFTAVKAHAETGRRSEIRKAILDSFKYNPNVRLNKLEQPPNDPTPQGEIDPEIIVLPKYEVTSQPLPRGLVEAVAKSRPMGPKKRSILGTGIHEKDFGKVRLSTVTILYIPIFVGLSW